MQASNEYSRERMCAILRMIPKKAKFHLKVLNFNYIRQKVEKESQQINYWKTLITTR
jgi:hypothetical protein